MSTVIWSFSLKDINGIRGWSHDRLHHCDTEVTSQTKGYLKAVVVLRIKLAYGVKVSLLQTACRQEVKKRHESNTETKMKAADQKCASGMSSSVFYLVICMSWQRSLPGTGSLILTPWQTGGTPGSPTDAHPGEEMMISHFHTSIFLSELTVLFYLVWVPAGFFIAVKQILLSILFYISV